MDGKNRQRLWRGISVAGLLVGMVWGMGVMGCAQDHRLSLTEFLHAQQEMEQRVPTSQPATSDTRVSLINRQLGPYTVGPGDVLLLTFTGTGPDPLFAPVQVRVDHEGMIDLPVVKALKVGDLGLVDIEDAILKAYVPAVVKSAVVHAQLVFAESTDVLVHGAVTLPGLVQLHRTERNLLYAIHKAGGISELSSGRATLQRIRRPEEVVTLDLTRPEGLRAVLALDPLEDGDIVSVEAAPTNAIFVGGLVNAPRTQVYPPGVKLSALQALAAAGGLRTDVTPRTATLIRRMPNNEDAHVKLDLHRISTGEAPNIMLAAGDILWVPETVETRVQDWINRNIFIRAGVSANLNYSVSGIEFINRHGQQSGGGGSSQGLEDSFDPFGFLQRGSAINALQPGG